MNYDWAMMTASSDHSDSSFSLFSPALDATYVVRPTLYFTLNEPLTNAGGTVAVQFSGANSTSCQCNDVQCLHINRETSGPYMSVTFTARTPVPVPALGQ